ncbi:MAG: hypothetical protein IT244_13745 [Bacteroidia bacterium]|nr:hypothetical protein [Bacteroidia bacterium]
MLNTLIYIHLNPVKHGFTSDFSNWEFTSYHEYMKPQPSQITKPTEMINGIFSTDNFKNYIPVKVSKFFEEMNGNKKDHLIIYRQNSYYPSTSNYGIETDLDVHLNFK